MKKIILFLFCLHTFSECYSQAKLKPIASDCSNAIKINIKSTSVYGVTVPPNGFGNVQEFNRSNRFAFEQEHHSAWYLLNIEKEGDLVFDIIPQDSTNDYDFALYRYTDSSFCKQAFSSQTPIRSNLSNNKKNRGLTGLKASKQLQNNSAEGPGNSYSASLTVKTGEKYMLIVDNFSEKGLGHTLEFAYSKNVIITGQIANTEGKGVEAEIILTDKKGATVLETKSDAKGAYKITTDIKEDQNYYLSYVSDSTFVETKTINTKDLTNGNTFPPIKTVLHKLKKGEKYKLGNIYFYGDAATLLPSSYPSVESLYKLMKKNKKLVIQIEGHVNDPDYSGKNKKLVVFNQTLSEERAITIVNYLKSKGISESRMTYVGLSNKFPVYRSPKTESEQEANRRVEIKVVSME